MASVMEGGLFDLLTHPLVIVGLVAVQRTIHHAVTFILGPPTP